MKKIILTIALILYFGNANSQINNLSDLLQVSSLSVYGLTENLQYTWEILKPTEKYSEDGKKITGTYPFTYKKNNGQNQIIFRYVTMFTHSNSENIELTKFVCNDLELLKRILKNLPYKGFELKGKQDGASLYEDGNHMITIQLVSNKNQKLPKGCYSIAVVY